MERKCKKAVVACSQVVTRHFSEQGAGGSHSTVPFAGVVVSTQRVLIYVRELNSGLRKRGISCILFPPSIASDGDLLLPHSFQ
jgi:hypothetical protein